MENEKVKKVNPLYMLAYIFLPMMLFSGIGGASVVLIKNSGVGALIMGVLFFALVIWYGIGGQKF